MLQDRAIWTLSKGPTVAATLEDRELLITEALDPDRFLRSVDFGENAPSFLEQPRTTLRLVHIHCDAGEVMRFPELEGSDETGNCYKSHGKIYINCGDRLVVWDDLHTIWRTVVSISDLALQADFEELAEATVLQHPVFFFADAIFCLWHNPHLRNAWISRTQGGRHKVSDPMKAQWVAWTPHGAELIVRTSESDPDIPSLLRRIRCEDVQAVLTKQCDRGSRLLAWGSQLFFDEEATAQVLANGDKCSFDFDNDEPLKPGDVRVASIQGSGAQGRNILACYQASSLEPQKKWNLSGTSGHSIDLTVLPERRGLLVTVRNDNRVVAEILNHRTPRPFAINSWEGCLVGKPVVAWPFVLWLMHRGGIDELHDQWPYFRTEYEGSKQRSAAGVVLETRWRDHPPVLFACTPEYSLEILKLDTGEWWYVEPLQSQTPIHSIHLCQVAHSQLDPLLMVVTRSSVFATSLSDVLADAKQGRPMSSYVVGGTLPMVDEALHGVPFSGPRDDNWGFALDNPRFEQVVNAVLPPDRQSFWQGDASYLASELETLTENVCQGVLRKWPNVAQKLAKKLQRSGVATLVDYQSRTWDDTVFGRLCMQHPVAPRLGSWRHSTEQTLLRNVDPESAKAHARFLLHEYTRRCKNQLTLSQDVFQSGERPAVTSGHSYVIREVLSWCNTPVLRSPEETHSWFRDELRLPFDAVARLEAEWPGGSPPLIHDTEGHLGFDLALRDLGLLSPRRRSFIQSAVARAWSNPQVRDGRDIFVSYSHHWSAFAHQLCDRMNQQGIGTALDAVDLRATADDWEVETWIAENVMRARVMIYLVSKEFLGSGWIESETDWELRLRSVKDEVALPYFVFLDREPDLEGYPPGRLIDGRSCLQGPRFDRLVDELIARLTLDELWCLHCVSKGRDPITGIVWP